MTLLKEYVLAMRPWSFTAALIPILVTAAASNASFLSESFTRSMVMGIAVQAGANLTNTYFDFVNGVDSKDTPCGEKTLVDRKVSPNGLLVLSILCYLLGFLSVLPFLSINLSLTAIFFAGIMLAFFYTATPVGLKYKALGDITIFLCFGPLLMQGVSILLTNEINNELYIYSIPIGLLTEAILHANNARDIKADTKAGAITLASLLGARLSYKFYIGLLAFSYVSIAYISLYLHWGCIASALTIPLAFALNKNYMAGKMIELPEETAKLHLPFGVFMLLGILFTDSGFLK